MAFLVLFKNKNTFLFLYFIWLLLNLQMCQVILPDPVVVVICFTVVVLDVTASQPQSCSTPGKFS